MKDAIAEYLRKRAEIDAYPLVKTDTQNVEQVVVIPALAEYPGLLDTLSDLEVNAARPLERTLVIVVVNNRALPHACAEDIANNRQCLDALAARIRHGGPLRLAYIDASAPGRELPEKGGVGLARKIGLDHGLAVLHENQKPRGALISLDADTRVQPNYLEALSAFFAKNGRWAAVVNYAHPLDNPVLAPAILWYELFLRYHELGLAYAGSPYAFPTIGSTIACTGEAYAAVSGMNRRQAGEDFYFLQQLAKTGPVERVTGTTVAPAARRSHRVPFGTGASMNLFFEEPPEAHRVYAPASYAILRQWMEYARGHLGDPPEALRRGAAPISPDLADFLAAQAFEDVWGRIQKNHRGADRLWAQFHGWFDAFRTLKLIHYLRDRSCPQQDLFTSLGLLLDWRGLRPPITLSAATHGDVEAQCAVLEFLRAEWGK